MDRKVCYINSDTSSRLLQVRCINNAKGSRKIKRRPLILLTKYYQHTQGEICETHTHTLKSWFSTPSSNTSFLHRNTHIHYKRSTCSATYNFVNIYQRQLTFFKISVLLVKKHSLVKLRHPANWPPEIYYTYTIVCDQLQSHT